MPEETPAPDRQLQDLALIEEAAKKSSLVWLTAPAAPPAAAASGASAQRGGRLGRGAQAAPSEKPQPPRPVWHIWLDGAVTLVGGGREQPLPPFARPGMTVEVSIRSKENGGRLVSWRSQVELLQPRTAEWETAAAALRAERLNLPEGDPTLDRWAAESAILRLKPLGAPLPQPTGSGAAQPVATPATTLGRQPRMIGGVRRSPSR